MLTLKLRIFFGFCLGILLFSLSVPATSFTASHEHHEKSLYDRLGGLMPISVVVNDFLDEMVPDPFLNQNPAIAAARKAVPAADLKYQVPPWSVRSPAALANTLAAT